MSAFKPDHMSGGGALQQRTTYLISLTLVKVEAVEENGGEARKVETQPAVETGSDLGKTRRAEDADGERKHLSPVKDQLSTATQVPGAGPEKPTCNPSITVPAERLQKTKSADLTQCTSRSVATTPPPEPSRTPTRTGLPIRPVGQRPVSLLKSHSSVASRGRDSREGRDRSPTSAQSLDRKDCRVSARSPGPCRASWAEASRPDGWRDLPDEVQSGTPLEIGGAVMRDIPRKERLKTGSASLPAPVSLASKPTRKGKSRTLDNSDLNSLSEDLSRVQEAQQVQQAQRGSAKDRKMLKFISGIFTKGSGTASPTAPPVYIQRDSSEEEGRSSQTRIISCTTPYTLRREPPLKQNVGGINGFRSHFTSLAKNLQTSSDYFGKKNLILIFQQLFLKKVMLVVMRAFCEIGEQSNNINEK